MVDRSLKISIALVDGYGEGSGSTIFLPLVDNADLAYGVLCEARILLGLFERDLRHVAGPAIIDGVSGESENRT